MENIAVFEQVFKEWAVPHVKSIVTAIAPNMGFETPKFLTMVGLPAKISLANEINVLIDPYVNVMFGKIKTLTSFVDDKDIPQFVHDVVDNLIKESKATGTYELFGMIQIPTSSYEALKEQLQANLPLNNIKNKKNDNTGV